mmetsp:Transcript_31930/g.63261  ORF Transcript_31930/g.63261 Transcript_31930/m.63261 type:complete len:89 (+) Transcript_31930:2303-2569(+)
MLTAFVSSVQNSIDRNFRYGVDTMVVTQSVNLSLFHKIFLFPSLPLSLCRQTGSALRVSLCYLLDLARETSKKKGSKGEAERVPGCDT